MTTGQRIQKARKALGLSQVELGRKLGVSGSMIGQYENDLRNPKKETLERIAVALGVSYFDLMSKQDRAMYEAGLKEGMEAEEWQNHVIDKLWKREGYSYSDIEVRLINLFSQLNDDGQQKAVERVEELTEIPKYQRTPPQEGGESPPPAREGEKDTAPAADAPEIPLEGE